MPEAPRFTRWFLLASDGPFPPLPGVVQCKIERLLSYPSGRSGMVWYGAGDIVELVVQARQVLPAHIEDALLVRYRPASDPEGDCRALLTRFERRFGALPHLQHVLTT